MFSNEQIPYKAANHVNTHSECFSLLGNQFEQAQKMMKMMAKGGMQKMLRGMKGFMPRTH